MSGLPLYSKRVPRKIPPPITHNQMRPPALAQGHVRFANRVNEDVHPESPIGTDLAFSEPPPEFRIQMEELRKQRIRELEDIYNSDEHVNVNFNVEPKKLLDNMLRLSWAAEDGKIAPDPNLDLITDLKNQLDEEKNKTSKLKSDLKIANEAISSLTLKLKSKDKEKSTLEAKVRELESKLAKPCSSDESPLNSPPIRKKHSESFSPTKSGGTRHGSPSRIPAFRRTKPLTPKNDDNISPRNRKGRSGSSDP